MVANILASLGILLALLGAAAMATWDASHSRPLLFTAMGATFGNLLLLGMQIVIAVGGISLAVWGLIYADWYIVVAAFVAFLLFVKTLPTLIPYALPFLTSAVGPLVCVLGIIALHFFTWFPQ